MLDLILIIMLIISLAKPDVLLSKKIKEKANTEQKLILAKNLRKQYSILIGLLESSALIRHVEAVGAILAVIFIVLFFTISLPAIKSNSKIIKELNI